jgi:hypothetical protein
MNLNKNATITVGKKNTAKLFSKTRRDYTSVV